jgi:hypothetical protein
VYVRKRDLYLVRWVGSDGLATHIVKIDEDNKLGEALCGLSPSDGWSRRGGSLKIYETSCATCNRIATDLGILKKSE